MNPSQPDETFPDIRVEPDVLIVPDEVLSSYNMDVRGVEPLATGSFNVHFRVHTESASYDLRRSNRPNNPTNLLYEADLLTHLRSKGFDLGPEIVPAGDGRNNVWHQDSGWTMFRWMGDGPGIIRQEMSVGRVEDAARTLAFHETASDFSSPSRRGDWPIFAGPEEWAGRWMRRAEVLAARLGADGSDLLRLAERATKELGDIELGPLPATVCHADYRPANLRFDDDSVAVVFDFDTAFRAP